MRFPQPVAERLDTHVRRLLASPGDPRVKAYPPGLILRADASLALEPRGHRPVVILFTDPASRASDLQAAEFLPVLMRYQDRIDAIPIDVSAKNAWTDAERKVVRRFYMSVVPTTVVLGADRRPLLLEYQRITAAALDTVIEEAVK
jgi:hypothetical protein